MNLHKRILSITIATLAAIILGLPSVVSGQLTLRVTVDTGFTEIVNDGVSSLEIDGYSVSSPAGQLSGTWNSLADQGLAGWDEADNSDASRVTEFNPLGSSEIAEGGSFSLGEVFVPIDGVGNDVAFQYTTTNGLTTVGDVSVATALGLSVDRGTGEVTLFNRTGGQIDLDGYSISSPSSSLGDAWQSFQDRSVAGWDEADNSDATRVTEFNPVGSSVIGGNERISLGALYAPAAPVSIGAILPEDMTFAYTSPTGKSLQGDVEYSGALNNVVLSIDPTSGNATIQNQSPFFDIAIDAYTITSTNGQLNTSGWSSLESQGIAGWDVADNADAFRVTEFNPVSQTELAGGGTTLDLGAVFSAGDVNLEDLSFQYLPTDGEAAEGLVVFSAVDVAGCVVPSGGIDGDFDGNGSVQFADFLVLSTNFGQVVSTYQEGDANCSGTVDFADFLLLSNNFGASVAEVAAVPEPNSVCLIAFGAVGLCLRKRRGEC